MSLIKLTIEDVNEGTENYMNAVAEATNEQFQEAVYHEDIELSSLLKITRVHKNYCDLSLDLPVDEGYLISFATDLDYCCYDCTTELWNNIVEDDDLISQCNMTDEYDESLFFLFRELEDECMNIELTTDTDLSKEIDVNCFIMDYKYKDLVDKDALKEAMVKSLKELQELIDRTVKCYFESEQYDDVMMEIELYVIDYYMDEINKNGFVEVYV